MTSYLGDDSHLSLAEFDPPSPMTEIYVPQLTSNEYEDQAATETERALKELIAFMEENPENYAKVLKRRKMDEKENSGIMSLLKVRLMKKMRGEHYGDAMVTQEEVQHKLEEVKTGMMMAYNYAQETKGRRYSRRLALKKAREVQLSAVNLNGANVPLTGAGMMAPPPPPPAPPCPPPTTMPPPAPPTRASMPPPPPPPPLPPVVLTPLKDNKHVMSSTPAPDPKQKLFRSDSTSSLTSIQSELTMTNPLKRLRATHIPRSPGGTPMSPLCRRPLRALDSPNPLNVSESLSSAFFRIMEAKFRNVRSPSPSANGNVTINSPSEFSP